MMNRIILKHTLVAILLTATSCNHFGSTRHKTLSGNKSESSSSDWETEEFELPIVKLEKEIRNQREMILQSFSRTTGCNLEDTEVSNLILQYTSKSVPKLVFDDFRKVDQSILEDRETHGLLQRIHFTHLHEWYVQLIPDLSSLTKALWCFEVNGTKKQELKDENGRKYTLEFENVDGLLFKEDTLGEHTEELYKIIRGNSSNEIKWTFENTLKEKSLQSTSLEKKIERSYQKFMNPNKSTDNIHIPYRTLFGHRIVKVTDQENNLVQWLLY